MTDSALNLLSLDRPAMESFFHGLGEQRFRAKQMLQWLYQRNTTRYADMTDFSKPLRQKLQATTHLSRPTIVAHQQSVDGTRKWLLKLHDGNCIETVYIPEATRATLCVSSQVGCALNCTFCATAQQGFNRNLTVDEIISQLWLASHAVQTTANSATMAESCAPHAQSNEQSTGPNPAKPRAVTNVVLMGMGEPLLNYEQVVPAMRLMMDDYSFGLSRRRVTLSTAGVVPAIDQLRQDCPVSLAVSLHAPTNDLRAQLVPLNKKYPLEVLLASCRRYTETHGQPITFEYAMLRDVNDSATHAKQLAKLLRDTRAKVNLIPFNPFPGTLYSRSSDTAIAQFREILQSKNLFTMTRKTRGDDIAAACGQLVGNFQDRTRRTQNIQPPSLSLQSAEGV